MERDPERRLTAEVLGTAIPVFFAAGAAVAALGLGDNPEIAPAIDGAGTNGVLTVPAVPGRRA